MTLNISKTLPSGVHTASTSRPPRTADPGKLGSGVCRPLGEHDAEGRDDSVEEGVVERCRLDIFLEEWNLQPAGRRKVAGGVQQVRCDVHAGDLEAALGEAPGGPAGTRRGVEDTHAGCRRQPVDCVFDGIEDAAAYLIVGGATTRPHGRPLMSRALLSRRPRELAANGIVARNDAGTYRLTEAGEALGPIVIGMGLWGQRWVESAADGPDWDAGVLMWDMRRRIDTDILPPGRTVVRFDYSDAPPELRRWWLLIEDQDVDLCQSDPGFDVDLYIATSVRVMGPVWIGQRPLAPAIERESIRVHGRRDLARTVGRWLKLSVIAEQAAHSGRPQVGSRAP
jgi:hypothetical protein